MDEDVDEDVDEEEDKGEDEDVDEVKEENEDDEEDVEGSGANVHTEPAVQRRDAESLEQLVDQHRYVDHPAAPKMSVSALPLNVRPS